jgi:glycosyltransferase involved in cell wall biosynthesis
MDVFCLPSLREGMPNVLLEAMAMEVPVVATDLPGVSSTVTPELDGLLIDSIKIDDFFQALTSLASNAAVRQLIAANARKTVAQRYSFGFRISIIANQYQALCSG